jgi:hypothetical protein
MNEKQMVNVLSLSSEDRYLHFLNKAADWEQLWVLCAEDGNLFTRETNEIEYLPIWPHPDYAKEIGSCLDVALVPSEVSLGDFMEKWLSGLQSDGLKVGVFPDKEGNVWIVEPKDLFTALQEECEQHE